MVAHVLSVHLENARAVAGRGRRSRSKYPDTPDGREAHSAFLVDEAERLSRPETV